MRIPTSERGGYARSELLPGIVGCTAMSTGGIAAVAGAAGPVIGGVLTGTLGWPSVSLVNVPLAAVAVGLTVVAIPADTAPAQHARIDFAGAGLLAIMITAFIVGLAHLRTGAGPLLRSGGFCW
jgi:MFS family permease